MEKLITRILLISSLIGIPFGIYFFFDDHYAKASDVAQVQQLIQQLQESISYDHLIKQRSDIQQRIWAISDRYEDTNKAPITIKEELRTLQQDIINLNDKIKLLESKGK